MTHTLPRPWDTFDAYLFDIDGTLVHSNDATHYFAFSHALQLLANRPLTIDAVTAHGNVDTGILRDALLHAGEPESSWRPRLPAARAAMCDFVATRREDLRLTVLPQVVRVLEHLRAQGATLGVATGNLQRIGQLKLEHAGLWHHFHFGGWSDAYEYRPDVIRAAIAQARALRGPDATLCVLGDTPADITAAHANGLPVIAVATGIFPYQQLSQAHPEMLLHSFADLFPPPA